MIKGAALCILAATATVLNVASAQAADLGTLSKYLAYIESFQRIFEFCQAETKLQEKAVKYAREHIGERRALILSGLNQRQREKVYAEGEATRGKVLDHFIEHLEDRPNKGLAELCRTDGFFAGIVASETKAQDQEIAAIKKAKSTR